MNRLILACLLFVATGARADYQVGKIYWFTSGVCFRNDWGSLNCSDVSPMKGKVYGISKSGIPLIEVLNGPNRGIKNSCYELPQGDPTYCADNSSLLETTSVDDAATHQLGQKIRWAQIAPIAPTSIMPDPYTCVNARMIDTQSGSIDSDFSAGQNLRSHGMVYSVPFNDSTGGLDQTFSLAALRSLAVGGCNVKPGDKVEIFGSENVEMVDNLDHYAYVARVYNSDGSKKFGGLSDIFVYVSSSDVSN
jgi:hypothetical protein